MSTQITETTEQFLKHLEQNYTNHQGRGTAENLVDELLLSLYPDIEPAKTTHRMVINSAHARFEKLERNQAADNDKWVHVRQMDLFGSGAFKLPAAFLPKSIEEADQFMTNKAQQEQAAADELADAWQRQQDKARHVAAWSEELHKLKQGVIAVGMNPEEVSVEQAIQEAAKVQPFSASGTRPTAERPLC
jgi:hypothetical protein